MARARARMETLKGHSSTPWQSTILHIGKHLQIYLFRIINLNILKQKSSDGGGVGGEVMVVMVVVEVKLVDVMAEEVGVGVGYGGALL